MPVDSTTTKPSKRIAYIGKGHNYWQELQNKFIQIYPESDFTFLNFYEAKAEYIKCLLHKISALNIECLLIDYSIHPQEMLSLAMSIKREQMTAHITVIGLLENLSSKDLLVKSLSLGICVNFVKSIEFTALAHHAFTITYQKEAKEINFAVAKIKFKTKAVTFFKAGYLTDIYAHMECDFDFGINDEIDLQLTLNEKLKCEHFKILKKGENNIYSNFKYWYNIEYVFDYNAKILSIEERIKTLENKRHKIADSKETKSANRNLDFDIGLLQGELSQLHEKMKKRADNIAHESVAWIKSNQALSRPKRTTILVLDKDMNILYQSKAPLDHYNFSLRHQSQGDETWNIIPKSMAGIICFAMEYPAGVTSFLNPPPPATSQNENGSEGESKEEVPIIIDDGFQKNKNNILALTDMITRIKEIKKYRPYIFVFNCQENSDDLNKKIQYKNIIYDKGKIDLATIQNFANMYTLKKGRERTHNPELSTADKEERVYISKYSPISIMNFSIQIEVLQISELDLVFTSTTKIPLYTSFYIKMPIKMTATVIPPKPKERFREGQYYAIISGLGELEKNELRKFINKLMFSDIEDKRQKEAQEFKELNKKEKEKRG